MSSTEVKTDDQVANDSESCDLKLEVVTLPVTDVDREDFYECLGWRLDADIAVGDSFRAVQFTPTHSSCSIAFGKGLTDAESGSAQRLILVVSDIDGARNALIGRGVNASEVFHLAGGRVWGPDRSAGPTRPTPPSVIPTVTGGCFRRSRLGFPAGSGKTELVEKTALPTQPRRRTSHPDASTTTGRASREESMTADQAAPQAAYASTPNRFIEAANGIEYVYRSIGAGAVPLLLFQHFRGNLDNLDPVLVDTLAAAHQVVTFDNAGVGGSRVRRPTPLNRWRSMRSSSSLQ